MNNKLNQSNIKYKISAKVFKSAKEIYEESDFLPLFVINEDLKEVAGTLVTYGVLDVLLEAFVNFHQVLNIVQDISVNLFTQHPILSIT